MAGVFSYESSEIDWCEDNYKYSEHVVEYFNTMSSFFFFIISPIMLYLLHPYAKERNLAIHMVWTMMIFVGIFSAYFHMTLSFMGQMLDELSILWVLAMGYAVWFPRRLFPSFIKERSTFSSLILVVTVITTVSSFVKPTANAYVLNCFGLHLLYVLAVEMRCCTDRKALRLAKLSVALWVLAISCWISDRFGCSFWQRLNFCYLHGIWHILIVIAVAYASTLIAYLDANYEIPYSLPGLQYWPCDKWAVGLPHIVLNGVSTLSLLALPVTPMQPSSQHGTGAAEKDNLEVDHLRCETLAFNNPTKEFRRKLIKAGGVMVVPKGPEAATGSSPDCCLPPTKKIQDLPCVRETQQIMK